MDCQTETRAILLLLVTILHVTLARSVTTAGSLDTGIKSPPKPLVDFKLTIPVHVEHMDGVSVTWLENHQELIRDLFSRGTVKDRDFISLSDNAFRNEGQDDKMAEETLTTIPQISDKGIGLFELGEDMREQFPREVVTVKRTNIDCDMYKTALETLMVYLKSGKLCGSRTAGVRFGIGK